MASEGEEECLWKLMDERCLTDKRGRKAARGSAELSTISPVRQYRKVCMFESSI